MDPGVRGLLAGAGPGSHTEPAPVNIPCTNLMPFLAEGAPRYRVERFIAEGGMACVFEGFDTQLHIRVALKVLKLEKATAITAERFKREGRAQAQASHPNIVRLYDAIETPNGLLVLVLEYVDGPTLQRVLEQGPLGLKEVRDIGLQLLSALQCAHEHGITHRDIKPSNIFIRGDQALLGDFGIASASDSGETTLTSPGRQIGTPLYMAPEQRLGFPADHRSDLYALGLVLRECAVGLPPNDPRTSSKEAWGRAPANLRATIERAVLDDPIGRWQTAATFREALAATSRPFSRWRRLGLIPVGALAVALLLLGGAAVRGTLCQATGWRMLCPEPAQLRPADLAILPFVVQGGGTEGLRLAREVREDLEWHTVINLMPMARVVAWWDSLPAARRDDTDPPGTRKYTRGSIVQAAGRVDVTLEVVDSTGQLYERIKASGDSGQLQRLARSLADSIACKVFTRDCATYRSMAYRAVSKRARDEFFAGKDSVAKGNWKAGERHFADAIKLDPGFMPARWELMIAKRFRREDYSADLQFIARNIDSFPPFYRRLATASLTPDLRQRIGLYEDEVSDSRQNGTALLLYANELFHRGALIGRPLDVTVDTLELLARTEPELNHISTYDIAWWGNLRLGREREAWDDLARREALGPPPGDTYKDFQHLATYARFSPWRATVARTVLLHSPDRSTLNSLSNFTRLGTLMDIPHEQLALGNILVSRHLSEDQLYSGLLGLASAELMLGRPGAALVQLDSASTLVGTAEMQLQQREWPVHLAALGLFADTARVARARAWLETAMLNDSASVRALYALGRDAAAGRDTIRLASLVAQLAVLGHRLPSATRHATLLAAELVAARGDYQAALDSTSVIFLRDTSVMHLSPFARTATYLNRGRWQLKLGRPVDADKAWLWYESADFIGWPVGPPQEGEIDAILSVYARLLRGDLAADRGNRTAACGHLARVRELWRKAEPVMLELQARAQRAWEQAQCH